MKPIELIGHVDEQHRLLIELLPEIPSGPVNITFQPTTEEKERDWLALINHSWAKDWVDPREDIYSLQDSKSERDAGKCY